MTLLRERGAEHRVSNAELLFDLVYVFAVTQLSHYLIHQPTVEDALQAAILLGLVWEAWAYTMWVTNWLDPETVPVRAMLFATALASLVLSLAIPEAFVSRGWAVAIAYAAMQIGRTIFTIAVLRDDPGAAAQLSADPVLVPGEWHARRRRCRGGRACPRGVVGVRCHRRRPRRRDRVLLFPVLGRSSTRVWTVDGAHIAERCHAFVLIALGESIVVLGATLADLKHIDVTQMSVFLFGFLGVVGLWWIYFARSAESAAEVISTTSDPGRIARAYHEVHPVMVAGIIVIAAADDLVLQHPMTASAAITWTVLGGSVLYIGGHAIFKAYLWRVHPWSRIAAVVALVALLPIGSHVAPVALAACALVITVGVCVGDAIAARRSDAIPPG